MTRYIIYVDSIRYASCYGWYDARLIMRKLSRKYKNSRVWKEKSL